MESPNEVYIEGGQKKFYHVEGNDYVDESKK